MYLIESTDNKTKMTAKPPRGGGFSAEQAAEAAVMEIWGSSFEDSGDDWCEFRLRDEAGREVASRRIQGY